MKENTEIEDYDELHDQYFDSVAVTAFNQTQSAIISPGSSPQSTFSSKGNKSDSDTSKSNVTFENDEKELWLCFTSGTKKKCLKKSLSDFQQPSTSGLGVENGKQLPARNISKNDLTQPKVDGKDSRKNKRSGKKEGGKPENEVSKRSGSAIKKISFKVKDKTPAQTEFLKFRRNYAEKIKKLIQSSTPFGSKPDRTKNFNVCRTSSPIDQVGCLDSVHNTDQNAEFRNAFQQNEQVSKCLDEEMDWEPSNEESDVRNINEFRQQQGRGETSNHSFNELNGCHKTILPSQEQELVLVLDTNIFVSCLSFVKELRYAKIGDLGYASIYVPWRVLQELDRLKDNKIEGADKQLSLNVRKAISFLNENFKLKRPRVYGQSFEDFNKMMEFNNFAPDDEILQTCIQLKKRHLNIKLMLLTNDKNFESKANVSGVRVYSKESFEKEYLKANVSSSTCNNRPNVITTSMQGQVLQRELQIDSYVCEIKALLKDFLSILLETEMRVAFEADWIKVIHKKPPWTTKEALDCFLKHWRSVFFLVFSKVTLNEAENLNKKLFIKEPANMEDVSEVISISKRFIKSIISSQKKKRPYLQLIDDLITKLSGLLKETPANFNTPQVDSHTSQAQFHLNSTSNECFNQVQGNADEITPQDISKVKNLFRDIWESLRSFCCSVSDVINSPNPSCNASLPELRLKLTQILNEVGELTLSLEKIFEIDVHDIHECHPLIIHFAQFLSNLYPVINSDLENKFPKCLATFFTYFEGRSLLRKSLTDFREFSQELIKSSEFFKLHFF